MNIKELNIALLNPDFAIELLELFAKYGFVSELEIRNAVIRKEYFLARQNGETTEVFMERMAEKYNCSAKNINSILFSKPRKKYKQIKSKYSFEEINNEKSDNTQSSKNPK